MTDTPIIELVIPGHFLSERKRQFGRFRVDLPDRKEFKAKVALFAKLAYKGPLLDEPLRIEIIWQMVKPKSYRRHENWPWRRPDLDNYLKPALDAMEGIIFRDDAAFCDEHVVKQFGDTQEIRVRIWRLCDDWPY